MFVCYFSCAWGKSSTSSCVTSLLHLAHCGLRWGRVRSLKADGQPGWQAMGGSMQHGPKAWACACMPWEIGARKGMRVRKGSAGSEQQISARKISKEYYATREGGCTGRDGCFEQAAAGHRGIIMKCGTRRRLVTESVQPGRKTRQAFVTRPHPPGTLMLPCWRPGAARGSHWHRCRRCTGCRNCASGPQCRHCCRRTAAARC